ncbi:hypothetical protein QBC37DRAFT_291761 [Rhypophila decipiens]|uniref:Uncharacterized protein n=1 Tax=Rhypophila decipiens TaxID=261697 RepID=A0AAN6Y1B2_9PEZI|nr:hypothetical protein QBC37DRAFT_291761 [Rhypophila decipiens]
MSLHPGQYLGSPQRAQDESALNGHDPQWAVSPTTPVDASSQQIPVTPHQPPDTFSLPEQYGVPYAQGPYTFVPSNGYNLGPYASPSSQPGASPILASVYTAQPLLHSNSGSGQPGLPLIPDGGSSTPNVPSQEKATSEPFDWWWWWEIAAALLSITSMCLIIAILFNVRNRPLSSWPLAIQPNSAIAILTTGGKAAMMVTIASCISQLKWRHMQQRAHPLHHLQLFDDASRGPWGSLVMLTRFSLGSVLGWSLAIVTIAALGIEPSAQNILTFELQQVNLTNITAEMAVAPNYYSKAFAQAKWQIESATVITNDLPHFQAAILNGLSGQVLDPSFTCPPPAVNCTWPAFKSLGICASFQEVTEGASRNCSTPKGKWNFVKNCTYTNIPGWFVNRTNGDDDPMLGYQNADAANGLAKQSQTLLSDFQVPEFGKWKWLIIRHDDHNWPDLKTPPPPRIFVANFSFCEKTYTGIERAAQNLNSPDTTALGETSSEPLTWTSSCELLGDGCGRYTTKDGSTSYDVTRSLIYGIGSQIGAILDREGYAYLSGSSQAAGPPPASAMNVEYLLENTPDLDTLVNNFADTLTNLIRNNETGDNLLATTVQGTAYGREQFVIVRWEWLILPVLETVLASGLLVICIVATRSTENGLPQLKTSVIAYLAYPTRGWTEEDMAIAGKQRSEKLEELSKGMNARFVADDQGRWRFWRA